LILNPFDLTAGPFLTLYVGITAGLFFLGFYLRNNLGQKRVPESELTAFELAYLAGGSTRLGETILLSLLTGNSAVVSADGQTINVSNQVPIRSHISKPDRISFPSDMSVGDFHRTVEPWVTQVQERLQSLGYTPTLDQLAPFRLTFLPAYLFVLIFGLIRFVLGVQRGHPVGFLVIIILVTAVAALCMLAIEPSRTIAGSAILRKHQVRHARAARAPLDDEWLLAIALSGSVVLSGTSYAAVFTASRKSDSGGSGCGGDGGGCGGCGGCGG